MAAKRHRLIQRRTKLGFTQERLAELMEVDVSSIQRWEAGGGIKPWMRPKLAQHLKVSLDDLDVILADMTEDDPAPNNRLTNALQNPTNVAVVITTSGPGDPDHLRHGPNNLIGRAVKDASSASLDHALDQPVAAGEALLALATGRNSNNEIAVPAPAGRFFTGTAIAARAFPASDDGRILATVPTGFADDGLQGGVGIITIAIGIRTIAATAFA